MKFPKEIYLTIEEESGGDKYLNMNEALKDAAVIGEAKKVGIYKLQKIMVVETMVKLK